MKREKGFTLIEIMIVVAIVGILVGIAVPSYLNSIQKTRRTEAKDALVRIAALQERYFFTNNKYGSLEELNVPTKTENGLYSLLKVQCGSTPHDCLSTEFKFQASAVAGKAQEKDSVCQKFYIDNVGQRSALSSTLVSTTVECWQ